MKTRWIVVLAVALLAAVAGADPLLDSAREKEKAGDNEAAASLLGSWLAANSGSTAAPSVFAEYVTVEQDFPVLMERASLFLKTARGVPGAAQQFQTIARLFELAGRVEPARDAWLAAGQEGAPDSALVSAFLLSLQMNDADSMATVLQQLSGSSAGARILLQALSDLKQGRGAAARSALLGLSEQTGDPELSLKATWVLYQSATEAGDTTGQETARGRLRQKFALSPESALASSSASPTSQNARPTVVPAPAPGPLNGAATSQPPAAAAEGPTPPADGGASSAPAVAPTPPAAPTPPVTAAPSPGPAPAVPPAVAPAASGAPSSSPAPSPATFSVQAGSFGMKENADDLMSELSRRSFTPVLVRDLVQGKDHYRVLAGAGLDVDSAKAVLARLSAAGFSGFIVKDR